MPLAAEKKEKTAWDGDQQYEVMPTDSFVLHPEIKVGREGGREGGREVKKCVMLTECLKTQGERH